MANNVDDAEYVLFQTRLEYILDTRQVSSCDMQQI